MKSSTRDLTAQQIAFANARLEGLQPSDAYRRAYNSHSNSGVIAVRACELGKHQGINAYIAKEQAKLDRTKGLTRLRKRQILYNIATDPNSSTSDIIRAIETDNRMTGDNRPEQVEGFGVSELLTMVRQRSSQLRQLN